MRSEEERIHSHEVNLSGDQHARGVRRTSTGWRSPGMMMPSRCVREEWGRERRAGDIRVVRYVRAVRRQHAVVARARLPVGRADVFARCRGRSPRGVAMGAGTRLPVGFGERCSGAACCGALDVMHRRGSTAASGMSGRVHRR